MKIKQFKIAFIFGLFVISIGFANTTTKKNIEYQNTYAVVIGIADYKYQNTVSDLTWTINDAEKFIKFLKSDKGGNVPNENIYYFKDSKAKKANIIKYAEELYKKAGPNDRVIFFFSGHGIEGAFIPYDGAYNANTNKFYNLLNFSDLKDIMKSANSKIKLIFADACHSGSLKKSNPKSKDLNFDDTAVAIMVATSANEFSREYNKLKQGVFSYFLILGLEGYADANSDKKVTIKELHNYVFKKVKTYNPKQSPVTFGKFDKDMVVGFLN